MSRQRSQEVKSAIPTATPAGALEPASWPGLFCTRAASSPATMCYT